MRLNGKMAIVTGGVHGMGEAEARSSRRKAPRS
jgi:NAD(P)-dependent dehydrogenase (short-subunit alcohol dehydrogenase family)